MTDLIRQKPTVLAVVSIFALVGCPPSSATSDEPPIPGKPPVAAELIQIQIIAPDEYIRGGVFELRAEYEVDGKLLYSEVDERVLESDASFFVELPKRSQWSLKEVQAELRHPKYKPTIGVIGGSEDLAQMAVTLRPKRWTTNDSNNFIKPAYETLVEASEHLRWIRTEYFQRPERLLVNETFQEHHRLVAMMAYGGGGKKGEWEKLRQTTIAEWHAIKKLMDERSYEPCPPGYVLETLINRPCGALVFEETIPNPNAAAERAARRAEEGRQIIFATADLAKQLQVTEKGVRLQGYERVMWDSTAIGCPEESKAYKSEERPGYVIIFSGYEMGTFFYHGKMNEMPFHCPKEKRTW